MKIKLERSGGITGMTSSFSADTNTFSPNEADHIQQLINDAKFFDLPAEAAPPPKRAADYFEYVITIEKEGMKPHTIKTTDITMPSTLKPLINFLLNKQRTISK
jgi:hypothetical protein